MISQRAPGCARFSYRHKARMDGGAPPQRFRTFQRSQAESGRQSSSEAVLRRVEGRKPELGIQRKAPTPRESRSSCPPHNSVVDHDEIARCQGRSSQRSSICFGNSGQSRDRFMRLVDSGPWKLMAPEFEQVEASETTIASSSGLREASVVAIGAVRGLTPFRSSPWQAPAGGFLLIAHVHLRNHIFDVVPEIRPISPLQGWFA
jgi:hypothetical protein